jgi:hypothetical protein
LIAEDYEIHINYSFYVQVKNSSVHREVQDRQCTYNVTSGRVRVNIFAVEKQVIIDIISVCIFFSHSRTVHLDSIKVFIY